MMTAQATLHDAAPTAGAAPAPDQRGRTAAAVPAPRPTAPAPVPAASALLPRWAKCYPSVVDRPRPGPSRLSVCSPA
jgi:hypothetical protein